MTTVSNQEFSKMDRMSAFYKYGILFAVIHGLLVTNLIILEGISDHTLGKGANLKV